MVFITVSCTLLWTSIHSLETLCLPNLIPWFIHHFLCLIIRIWFRFIPEWPNVSPYFLKFNTYFSGKELMIWATVSSRSHFFWLYTAPSFTEKKKKNIINLISVLTIWSCPYVELSVGLLEKAVCYGKAVLLIKFCKPLPFFILHTKAKLACYSGYLMTSYFCIPIPYDEKNILFWC